MLWLVLLALLGWTGLAQAQTDSCLWSSTLTIAPDIAVDATVGGVPVLAANGKRCGAQVQNTGTGDMRCGPVSTAVTATTGYLVKAGATWQVGAEGREAINCIRTTTTSTTVSVLQAISR